MNAPYKHRNNSDLLFMVLAKIEIKKIKTVNQTRQTAARPPNF